MNLDFLEIGTSDFDTLIEVADDFTVGISVEPIKHYQDRLPNKPNVKKINCAISPSNIEGNIDIFYIPDNVIKEHGLPWWLRGCNSVNSFHPKHIGLKITHLVKVETVKQIPISKFFIENNIEKIKYLKIDTEGADCDILQHLSEYLKTVDVDFYPETIIFESNKLTALEKINYTRNLYQQLGYIAETMKNNTKLTFEKRITE